MQERLQKLLAQAGYGPRRACGELLSQGVCVCEWTCRYSGSIADLSVDNVTLDGKALPKPEFLILTYIPLYKPAMYFLQQKDRMTVRLSAI